MIQKYIKEALQKVQLKVEQLKIQGFKLHLCL